MSIERPDCPVELASDIIMFRMSDPDYGNKFGVTKEQEADLVWLDKTASQADLLGDWRVQAGLGFITPRVIDTVADTEYVRINREVSLIGNFECYSWLSIGRLATSRQAVRAVCMTFTEGFVAKPLLEYIDDDSMLHIPVMAVTDIGRTD